MTISKWDIPIGVSSQLTKVNYLLQPSKTKTYIKYGYLSVMIVSDIVTHVKRRWRVAELHSSLSH